MHGPACTARGRLEASVHMADRAKAAAARTAAPVRRARGPEWWPSVYPFQLNQPAPADKQTACCGRPACRTPLAHECTVNPKRDPPLRSLPRLPRAGGARPAADRGSQQQVLSRLKSPGHSADGATERDSARAGRRAARPTCNAQARARATESESEGARADRAVQTQPCSADMVYPACREHRQTTRAPLPKWKHSKSGAARWQRRPHARNSPAWSRSPPRTTPVLRRPTPAHGLKRQPAYAKHPTPVRSPPL